MKSPTTNEAEPSDPLTDDDLKRIAGERFAMCEGRELEFDPMTWVMMALRAVARQSYCIGQDNARAGLATMSPQPSESLAVLATVRAILEVENHKENGAICDTIWFDYETLFDYIDRNLAALGTTGEPKP